MTSQHFRHEPNAANVLVAIFFAKAEAPGQVPANLIPIQQFNPVAARPEALVNRPAQGGLACGAKTR